MPPLIAGAVIAGVGATGFTAFAIQIGLSFAFSLASRAIAPKPKSSSFQSQATSAGINIAVRRPDDTHKHVYGVTRHPSLMLYDLGVSADNKYYYFITVCAAHEVVGYIEHWLGDVSITPDMLDANGLVTSGPYAGKVRIRPHLGSPNQTHDPVLVAEIPGLDSNFRGREIAYVYWRLEYDQNLFASGPPNPGHVLIGKPITDPRDNVSRATSNLGLFAYEYFRNEVAGYGAASNRFDPTQNAAQLNICEEMVTTASVSHTVTAVASSTDILSLNGDLCKFNFFDRCQLTTTGTLPAGLSPSTNYWIRVYQYRGAPRVQLFSSFQDALDNIPVNITDAGSGTHTITKNAEMRYPGGGVIDTADPIGENLKEFQSGCAGRSVFTGAYIRFLPAAYTAPTLELDVRRDFRGAIDTDPWLKTEEAFNSIGGLFRSPLNNWQSADAPVYPPQAAQQDWIDADGGIPVRRDFPLNFTNSGTVAQRIFKIEFLRARQELGFKGAGSMKLFRETAGGGAFVTWPAKGWEGKAFEIAETQLNINPAGQDNLIKINMPTVFRETAPEIFDWSSSDDASFDPAPNTLLPNPFEVNPPTGLAFSSRSIGTVDGDEIFELVLMWNIATDQFVLSKDTGVNLRYRETGTTDWIPVKPVPGDSALAVMLTASPGVSYDLSARFVNNLGQPSAWTNLLNCAVGSSGGVSSSEDWESVADAASTTGDWGSVADAPSTDEDWGFVA
jgi:hypothetical protein